ncbi:hypothetical protein [Undibacterium sp. WLX3042]|uniref:hypothetical protein n=1 Tax=Undibacterium sp. WLX3042 TaxID=3412686 RepID=UPI003C306245
MSLLLTCICTVSLSPGRSPLAAFEHVNLKRRFAKARKIKEVGMARALQMVGLPLVVSQ